jgi:hypothetical protein
MRHNGMACLGPAVFLAALAAGCGNSCSVSGNVSYDGQPVEDGMITFLPTDGKGPSTGGKITGGKYQMDKLTPGPKVVQVLAVKALPSARSSEEMEKLAAAAKARGDTTGIIEQADVIPPDAEGNNARIEVQPGKQEINFDLKKPAKRKGP